MPLQTKKSIEFVKQKKSLKTLEQMGIRSYVMSSNHFTQQSKMNVLINAHSKIDSGQTQRS